MNTCEESKRINALRWRVVIGGFLCQFCAGLLYTWSLYVNPLIEHHGWDRSGLGVTFSIATLVIPVVMIPGAKILARVGPSKTVLLGGILLVSGLILSSFSSSLPMLYLGYGILGGTGVGMIYGVPIATSLKWFPDKKGLISGIIISGFGMGSILFAPLCTIFIENLGPHQAFLFQAAVTVVGLAIGIPMLKAAPDGFVPPGFRLADQGGMAFSYSYTPAQMLKKRQYWFLMLMYLFSNLSGLFIIGNASPISQDIAGLTVIQAGTIVSILAIANTAGRFFFGTLSDKIGAIRVVTIIYAINFVLMLSLRFMTSYALIAVGIAGIAICFGGMLGVYPALVADYFGTKHISMNYALVFLAYGVAAALVTPVAAISLNHFGDYNIAFIVIGISCGVGFLMSLISKKPIPPPAEQE